MPTRFRTTALPFVDIQKPAEPLASDTNALRVARTINTTYDEDGDASRLRWTEFLAASRAPSDSQTRQVLDRIQTQFFIDVPAVGVALNLPSGRAYIRDRLIDRGVPVFTGYFPDMIDIPQAVRDLKMRLPFESGARVIVNQGNNTMAEGTSHAPRHLRYAVDFGAEDNSKGMAVLAGAPGIAYAFSGGRDGKNDNWGFGNFVLVDHGNGYGSLYAHLHTVSVHTGDVVSGATKLGTMGATGLSGFPPHLHFQVVRMGSKPDPASQMHQSDVFDPNATYPSAPWVDVVPFEMLAADVTAGASQAKRVESWDFESAEAGRLPGWGHIYRAP